MDYLDKNSGIDFQKLLENCGAIVFVMDCQVAAEEAQTRLIETITSAYHVNPNISIEVFVHKVDVLTEEQQAEVQRRIPSAVRDGSVTLAGK